MYKGKKILAIVPARAGSKRLPNKNIKSLCGKPLIGWSIEAGASSSYVDKVIVSTDSDEIASVSKQFGADIPFLRPSELATDTASSFDVVKHSLDFFSSNGELYDVVVLLQPTSPLRNSIDLDKAIEFYLSKKANSVTSVCEVEHSPLWSNVLPENFSMRNFIRKSIKGKNSQGLKKYYRLNGAIYICNIEAFLIEKTFISSKRSFAFIMEQQSSVDIDTELDFIVAEAILSNRLKSV